MTRDEIANMATKAGLKKGPHYQKAGMATLEPFADLVAARHRDAMIQAVREIDWLPWATVKRVLEVMEGVQ